MCKNQKAFTLIELLVVVLIIGILSAIALPQYQKAVYKSKKAEAWSAIKSVLDAADEYKMINGTYPRTVMDLNLSLGQISQVGSAYVSHETVEAISLKHWNITSGKYPNSSYFYVDSNFGAAAIIVPYGDREGPYRCIGTFCPEIASSRIQIGTNSPDYYF